MSTINIDLAADTILNVMIGQQDENEVREVIFDFSGWYTTYGSGTISLAIQRPKDEWPYEGTLTVDSTNHKATWEISETDTAYAGTGQIQLSYKVGDAKKKSVVYRFTCHKSLGALGSVVTPVQIQTFIDEVEEALQTMDGRLDDMDDQITDVKQDFTQLEQDLDDDIADLREEFAEKEKRTEQLFNKYDFIKGKLYIRTSDYGLRSVNYCVSVTIPYNVEVGDRISLYASGDFSGFLSAYSFARIAISDTQPLANGTVKEYGTWTAKDNNHIESEFTATMTANYLLLSFVFDASTSESDVQSAFELIKESLTVCKLASGYPTTYIPYYIIDVQEDNLSSDIITKLNKSDVVDGYGVKWSLTDADDLGARCFGATGLSATVGIGSTSGQSDFDTIYPWSEIKRCNIKTNENGAFVVTYEGETGFALDGTNGDVFVRIPKFNILRYKRNGYEYRVIGATGTPVHEAFVEDGQELDEIFVGAFEGFIDENNKLKSIAGVIPTSNVTASDFLTDAVANGNNYTLYDLRTVDAIWSLIAVEFGCRNTNRIFGYGLSDFMQPTITSGQISADASNTNTVRAYIADRTISTGKLPIGGNITICDTVQTTIVAQRKITAITKVDTDEYDITFDGTPVSVTTDCFVGSGAFDTNWVSSSPTGALSYHTGRNNWVDGSNVQNAMRYRWIENLVGNLWHFLPDVTFHDLQMYVCKNIKDYAMFAHSDAYKPYGALLAMNTDNGNKNDVTGYNYWITSLLDDTFAKSALFGKTYDKSLTSDKAFGGYYYLYNGTRIIANGGGFDHLYRCNMLTNRAWIPSTGGGSQWYLYGARLMFKNIT